MRKYIILLIAAILSGCSSPESFENNPDVAEVSQELVFNVDVQWTNGSSDESRLSQHGLWKCLEKYCGEMWDDNKCTAIDDKTLNSQCRNLANHNQDKCMADFLTQMSESVDREVLWAAAKMPSNFWLDNPAAKAARATTGGVVGTCISKTVTDVTLKDIAVIRFDYPQTLAHREELRDMAFKFYFNAVLGAVRVLNPPPTETPPPDSQPELLPPTYNQTLSPVAVSNARYGRVKMYRSIDVDKLFMDTAKPLTWKMTSSLPSILRKMAELKYANAQERQTKRTKANDQWASTDHGALPVLWHLYGNVDDSERSEPTTSENLTQMMLLADLLPRDPRPETTDVNGKRPFLSPPPMTKSLEAAISLLAENEINIHAAMTQRNGATTAQTELVSRVDKKRVALGLPVYKEITKLLVDKALSKNDLDQALVYMYVHLTVFPRNISWTPSDPDSSTARLTGWYSPYISTPFGYYLNQMYSKHLQDKSGQWINTLTYTGLTEEGLVPALEFLENELVVATKIVAGAIVPPGQVVPLGQEVEQDKKMLSSLKDTLKELDRLLGGKRIFYAFESSGTDVDNVRLTLVNPTTTSANPTKALDQLALYAIDPTKLKEIEKFKGVLCFADATCRDTMPHKYFPELAACQAGDPAGLISGKFCQTGSTVSLPNKVNGVAAKLLWVVAHRTSAQGDWQPVGFIDPAKVMKWGISLRSGSIRLGSEIDAHAQSLISRDPENVSAAVCDPIGSGEECFDRDFVPAIDNEIVDPSGGQYEDSYRHYLSLAAEAAGKAKELREQLVGEYIDEAHESQVAQAQLESASDDYLREIEAICGNQTRADFEALVDLAESTVSPNQNFGEVLEGFMAKNVANGCLPAGAAPETRKDPIHCFEPRDCDGTLLRQLGVKVPAAAKPKKLRGATEEIAVGGNASCQKWKNDSLTNPNAVLSAGCSVDNKGNPAACAGEQLDRMICWLKSYRSRIAWLLETQSVAQVPEAYKPDLSIFKRVAEFTQKVDSQAQNKYGQGSYFATMLETSSTLENLQATADNYAALLDSAIQSIEVIRSSIKSNIAAADAQIATQWSAAIVTESTYQGGLETETIDCLKGKKDQLEKSNTVEKIVEALRNIDFTTAKQKTFGNLNTTEKFIYSCQEAIKNTAGMPEIFVAKRDVVCQTLADEVRNTVGGKKSDVVWEPGAGGGKSNMQWYCYKNKRGNEYCALAYEGLVEEIEKKGCWKDGGNKRMGSDLKDRNHCVPRLYLLCYMNKHGDSLVDHKISGSKNCRWDSKELKEVCDRVVDWWHTGTREDKDAQNLNLKHGAICNLDAGMWFRLPATDNVLIPIAEKVRSALFIDELNSCSNKDAGCTFSDLNWNGQGSIELPGSLVCKGPATDEVTNNLTDWDSDPPGDLTDKVKNSEFFQNQVQIADFGNKMIELLGKLAESRHGVSNLIRGLAGNVAALSKLEADQKNLFVDYLNKRNLAESATVTTLAEWKARHDIRRGQYADQLRRARIAAWMARRAIEFRFGVDLSQESTATNQGKAPSQWADDIYRAVGTRCGEEKVGAKDTDSGSENSVEKCYSAENMVEEYVQKLEDYVLSYGNSRYDQWWLHEDDDVAVISLRDHVLYSDRACTSGVENLLNFTEDLDMSLAKAEAVYGVDSAALSQPLGTWQGTEDVIADVMALGLPADVEREHNESKERMIFEDQAEDWTADVFVPSSANAALTQSVAMGWSLKDGEPTGVAADLQDKALQFSSFVRRAPLQSATDCSDYETFFPGLGRCGQPCTFEAVQVGQEWVQQHNCPQGMECIPAGQGLDGDGNSADLKMCVWCTADRSCIGQDGGTVVLGIQNKLSSGQYQFAQRRAPVSSEWTKVVADTVTHQSYLAQFPLDNAEVTVGVQPGRSQNLLPHSEYFSWWAGTGIGVRENSAVAPDGTMTADVIDTGDYGRGFNITVPSENALNSGVPQGSQFPFTVSFWAKTDHSDGANIRVNPMEYDANGKILAADSYQSRTLSDEWERVEVIGQGVSRSGGKFGFSVSAEPKRRVYIWGMQVELGSGAGEYVPKGKNLLDNTNLMNAPLGNGTRTVLRNEFNPNGTRGVTRIVKLAGQSFAVLGFTTAANVSPGTLAAFSFWMRGTPFVGDGVVYATFDNGQSVFKTMSVPSVTSEWRRVTLPFTMSHNVPVKLNVHLHLSGSGERQYEIWGPQVEVGSVATGYQSVSEPLEAFGQETLNPWTVGLSGLDLRPLDILTCRLDGTLDEKIPSTEGQDCVIQQTGYTRNTYLREHYSRSCELGSRSNEANSAFEDLFPYLSREDRVTQFSDSFTPFGSKDERTQVLVFPLSPESAQSGNSSQTGVLAQGNFNYRIRTVFVNIVGTDVIDCSKSPTPETCDANQWLSYDLKQMGDVRIRNHSLQDSLRTFNIPTGLIKGGKAWSAEQVIGYPISSAHQGMVSQMSKASLMGRPLDGVFELSIHETPEVAWENVEDIQLVLGYHYWTRSE